MFYSQTFLARKGPLSTVWIAAHLQHRLKKSQCASTDIPSTVRKSLQKDYYFFNLKFKSLYFFLKIPSGFGILWGKWFLILLGFNFSLKKKNVWEPWWWFKLVMSEFVFLFYLQNFLLILFLFYSFILLL
jgi:hypothetical protein